MEQQTSCCPTTGVPLFPDHPLDQLAPAEVSRASAAVRRHAAAVAALRGALRFNNVSLREPPKRVMLAYEAGAAPRPPRRAEVHVLHPSTRGFFEAVVQLNAAGAADEVVGWQQLEGVQPVTTPDDNVLAEQVINADPGIRRLVAERYGITDPALIVFDPWTLHGTPAGFKGRRLMQGFLYVRTCARDNEYAHPLDLVPLVDLDARRVVHVDMYDAPAAMPPRAVNYHRALQRETSGAAFRSDLRPIDVTQPEGASFVVDGSLVTWQKWRLRVGFNAREGLVLHNVGVLDGGVLRPVLHRASLVEMAVPYGDPNYPYIRKCALDVGDYGMGFVANSLELGCDCLGHIKYFDGVVSDAAGEPVTIRHAVCMHEEDAGLLWKHTDLRLRHVEQRRNRRLVLSMISTFANYEYGMYWYFYLDGTIQLEMKLTGILSTSVHPLGDAHPPPHGTLVAPGVVAANHQHLFCVRLDPAVDDADGGRNLLVTEVNADPLPVGPLNPAGNAFSVTETPLTSVHAAQRDADPVRSRAWKITNPGVVHPTTRKPVAWKLYPGPNPPMLMAPESLVARRAHFATKHLFVTPHDDAQRYPSGEHVVQSEDCHGLKVWTKGDAPLAGADPVVWYSFGITHLPRVEDFPIMSAENVGFTLKPFGFFNWNPTLDVPPAKNAASVLHDGDGVGGRGRRSGGGGGGGGGGGPTAPELVAVAARSRL